MTADYIADALTSAKGITPERIQKAKGLAQRSGVEWARVLEQLTSEQRAQVEQG